MNKKWILPGLLLLALLALGGGYLIVPELVEKAALKVYEIVSANITWSRLGKIGMMIGASFLLEILFMGWSRSTLGRLFRPRKTAVLDMVAYFLSAFSFVDYLVVLFSFSLSTLIPKYIKIYFGFEVIHSIDNILIQNLIYLIVIDLYTYWLHRWSHTSRSMWELHKFHHSATELNIMTTARIHPLETAIYNVIASFPLFLMGAPLETYIGFWLFSNFLGHLHHSMLPWNWGWVGKYILISPVAHRIHHSTEKVHYDKNFGHLTPLWDRAFGTWYAGDDVNEEVGVDDNYFNARGVIFDYINPVIRFGRSLIAPFLPSRDRSKAS